MVYTFVGIPIFVVEIYIPIVVSKSKELVIKIQENFDPEKESCPEYDFERKKSNLSTFLYYPSYYCVYMVHSIICFVP
jgi:hypothetical protein